MIRRITRSWGLSDLSPGPATLGRAFITLSARRTRPSFAILARSDLVLTNSGAILLSIPLRSGLALRLGAVDMLVYGVGSERVETNQVGGIVTVFIERVGAVRGIQPFVQVLGYTNHESRRLTFPLDVMLGVDLAAVLD